MEIETELYLIKRIKELEHQKEFLKKQLLHQAITNGCEKEKIRKQFVAEYQGYDLQKLLNKAKAFDKLKDILNVEIASFPNEKRHILYSPKHSKDKPSMFKQIDIDEETYDIIRRALKNDCND